MESEGSLPCSQEPSLVPILSQIDPVPRDSDLRMTALAKTSSNCKRQTHPLVREDIT
jgi:hypothetical protein